ncbi:class I SAM-dependent methyltransferase [Corynebacterium frankenforstense]|uniref:class I SAM-dependent methyltransferase n=1 Tax=Corynebacterium TaxID=1716 RepID=UPI002549FA11|nr:MULTISPECIES: class I SAM-dependent methyltransferase [Corynebacterium]MDK6259794.1 class I SAM-dependent methyltransferase [Corynebacterium frankenforstense]MDK8894264.1 class I SAM-dependent methyltransferase [Corynebacterium sp. MSK006]
MNKLNQDPFYCNTTMVKLYDELMETVDPDVDHVGWLRGAVGSDWPREILDYGAGSGRVLKKLRRSGCTSTFHAVEPDESFAKLLSDDSEIAPVHVENNLSAIDATNIGLVFCTYGSLQYVSGIEAIVEELTDIHRIVESGSGVCALELFSSEAYDEIEEPMTVPIYLADKMWQMTLNVEHFDDGLMTSTTELRDGEEFAVMRETVLPVSVETTRDLFAEANFQNISVKRHGAYNRCVAS